MTNREKLIEEFIANLDDDFLFRMFCEKRDCIGCIFGGSSLGCKDDFEEWLDEYAEEDNDE